MVISVLKTTSKMVYIGLFSKLRVEKFSQVSEVPLRNYSLTHSEVT